MYGSISRWRVKEGKQDELEQLAAEVMNDRAPGSRAVYMYRADADPREYWVAGVWRAARRTHRTALRRSRMRALSACVPCLSPIPSGTTGRSSYQADAPAHFGEAPPEVIGEERLGQASIRRSTQTGSPRGASRPFPGFRIYLLR